MCARLSIRMMPTSWTHVFRKQRRRLRPVYRNGRQRPGFSCGRCWARSRGHAAGATDSEDAHPLTDAEHLIRLNGLNIGAHVAVILAHGNLHPWVRVIPPRPQRRAYRQRPHRLPRRPHCRAHRRHHCRPRRRPRRLRLNRSASWFPRSSRAAATRLCRSVRSEQHAPRPGIGIAGKARGAAAQSQRQGGKGRDNDGFTH